VPFIARWPGKIPAGTTSDQLISNVDLLATMAAIVGHEVKPGVGRDSVNVLPAMVGTPDKMLRDHLVISPRSQKHITLREGDWLYIPRQGNGGFTATKIGSHALGGPAAHRLTGQVNSDIANGKIKKNAPSAQLYNLRTDPTQKRNVIGEHGDVASRMAARLKAMLAE